MKHAEMDHDARHPAGHKTKAEKTELEKRLEEKLEAEAAAAQVSEEAISKEKHDALLAERDGLKDQLLRARAEFENYRKRTARDHERMRAMAAESLIRDLLPVMDHLELALNHAEDNSGGLAEGVQLVLKQFSDVLSRHGLQPIPADGEPFDPAVHEAVTCVETDEFSPNTVTQEFQRGYKLGETVLRPSKVVVSSSPAQESQVENTEEQ